MLLSYDATKPQVLIAVILLAIKSWTTYPILMFCVRYGLISLVFRIVSSISSEYITLKTSLGFMVQFIVLNPYVRILSPAAQSVIILV